MLVQVDRRKKQPSELIRSLACTGETSNLVKLLVNAIILAIILPNRVGKEPKPLGCGKGLGLLLGLACPGDLVLPPTLVLYLTTTTEQTFFSFALLTVPISA